ncbi:putative amidohydrolase YtcJ [Paeniglutamicibacter cryotolerans]|uniref:Putative amidohydrolase YtcJ n=1 Tax=Paeniglutamicibacter cryotolerans TaxID=670079 RepID=A0A839QF23_9MICC|nr:putative amidohydrolase YtcJ [Paeniglutamicibacter cryotolerans]
MDLGGATVLPGFTDSHIHTASLARALTEVNMREIASLSEALERLAAASGRYVPQ